MANIRKESNRHQWQRQRVHMGHHQYVEMDVCLNCGLKWDEEQFGHKSKPVGGCPFDVNLRNVGRAREQDYDNKCLAATGRMIPWAE